MLNRLRRLLYDEGGFLQFLPMIASLGSILGGAGAGASRSRAEQNQLLSQRDQTEAHKYGTAQNAQMQLGNLDLQRKAFSEDAPLNRAKQAALADMLMNYTPRRVSVAGIPQAQISGGTSLGEGGRAGLAEMQKQALARLLAGRQGESFQGGQLLNAPRATPMQNAGLLEKILGIGGLAGGLAGAVGMNMPQSQGPSYSQVQQPQGLNPRLFGDLFQG